MFKRYAIYYTAQGAFAGQGAAWLGWDVDQWKAVAHPEIAGLDVAEITQTPRKYGFHGTLKAPFRLAKDMDETGLQGAVGAMASQMQSAEAGKLEVTTLGRFLALTPGKNDTAIRDLAARVVTELDMFRAPLNPVELARREKSNLSAAQHENLLHWGYPHVMAQFHFHMTLTSRLPRSDVARIKQRAQMHFDLVLPNPFWVDALTLVGERADGMFCTIQRFPLQ